MIFTGNGTYWYGNWGIRVELEEDNMIKWKVYKDKWIITNNKPRQADCVARLDTIGRRHAHLIAAAPDLLEALESVKSDADRTGYTSVDTILKVQQAIELANAP